MAMLKRAAPLPADKEALPGHVYVLFPMHRLHSRVSPEELTSLMGLFSSHFLSAHQPPCTRRVRTLQSLMQANSATAKVTPLSCTPTSEEEEIVIPAHLSASHHHEDASDGEDDIDALLQEFCAIAKNSPFSSAGSLHNSGSLARSRSWMPKLETINESSTLAE
ncbi:hypothetical protein KP509_16G044800 [Ceratopteris richardii]|nr:hypothetical protein KP509_16G044800 [Ceratopteris richardii]